MAQLKTWSYSRLAALTSCSMKYYLQYVEGWKPQKKGMSLERGSITHDIAQKILSGVDHFRTVENVMKAIEFAATPEDLAKIELEKYSKDTIRAGELLAEVTRGIVTASFGEYVTPRIEENIKFEIKKKNGHTAGIMTTYLDTHFMQGQEARLKHVIVEFKTTGKTPSGGDATLSNKKQAIIYNEALRFMYGRFAGNPIQIDYWIVYAVILSKEVKILPVKIEFSDFAFYDDVLNEVWNQIRMANSLEEDRGFSRVLSDMTCGWCQYKELCLEGKKEKFNKEARPAVSSAPTADSVA